MLPRIETKEAIGNFMKSLRTQLYVTKSWKYEGTVKPESSCYITTGDRFMENKQGVSCIDNGRSNVYYFTSHHYFT